MTQRKTIEVSGMACGGCEENVESALGNLDGVSRVDADHAAGTVEVVADEVDDDELTAAVHDAGFERAT